MQAQDVTITGQGNVDVPADFDAYLSWCKTHHGLTDDEIEISREDVATTISEDDYTKTWKESADFASWAKTQAELTASAIETETRKTVDRIVDMYCDAVADQGKRNLAIGREVLTGLLFRVAHFPGHNADDFNAYLGQIRDSIVLRITIEKSSIRLKLWLESALLHTAIAEAYGDDCAERVSFFELGKICPLAVKLDKASVTASIADRWLDFAHTLASDRLAGKRVSSSAFAERLDAHAKLVKSEALNALSPEDREREVTSAAQNERKREVQRVTNNASDAISEALKSGIVPALTLARMVDESAKEFKRDFPRWDSFGKDDMIALTTRLAQLGRIDLLRMMRDRVTMMVSKLDAIAEAHRAAVSAETPSVEASAA
jgi:hypothetical protein